MTGREPERIDALAHYRTRLEALIAGYADRAPGAPTPPEAAGMPWLPATAILSRAALAERWDPVPRQR